MTTAGQFFLRISCHYVKTRPSRIFSSILPLKVGYLADVDWKTNYVNGIWKEVKVYQRSSFLNLET